MKPKSTFLLRKIEKSDIDWIRNILTESWGSNKVVTRGVVYDADMLPGLIAEDEGQRLGLLTYNIHQGMLEIVTLNVPKKREGIGRRLVQEAITIANENSCYRVWVITTNDNTTAVKFYQEIGFRLVAIHKDAVEESRKLKPEIPLLGIDGIPIEDELEFAIDLKADDNRKT